MLPGDPLPPPKRDSQAFAESAATAWTTRTAAADVTLNSQPRDTGVQYALISLAIDPCARR